MELLGSVLSFLKNLHEIFHSGFHIPTNSVWVFPFLSILSNMSSFSW